MDTTAIQNEIYSHLRTHSGLDTKRKYLGMSGIAKCPRELFFDFVRGRQPNEQAHLYCYVGYLFERDVKARLGELGIYVPGSEMELVAPFDARFRGHIDGQTQDGMLLEIKSINEKAFELLLQTERAKPDHYLQVQTYMHFGTWTDAVIVYVCRDTFAHRVLHVAKSTMHGEEMERKAKMILRAIDEQRPPQCECHYCRR